MRPRRRHILRIRDPSRLWSGQYPEQIRSRLTPNSPSRTYLAQWVEGRQTSFLKPLGQSSAHRRATGVTEGTRMYALSATSPRNEGGHLARVGRLVRAVFALL